MGTFGFVCMEGSIVAKGKVSIELELRNMIILYMYFNYSCLVQPPWKKDGTCQRFHPMRVKKEAYLLLDNPVMIQEPI